MKHDCCEPKKTKLKGLPQIDPFLLWTGLITLIILVGVVIIGSRMGIAPQITISDQVALAANERSHDWGEIDYDSGIVSKTFTIKNEGDTPLQLYEVKTSCMCTTAQLITEGKKSVKFAMHDQSTAVFEVGPSQEAELLVEFDPAFHGPSGVGPVTRTVTVLTNSGENEQLVFQLAGNVVKK